MAAQPSPPHPQPGSDARDPNVTDPVPDAPVQAQSPARAHMDPLPPPLDRDLPLGVEGARRLPQGADHRDDVAEQRPVPSEGMQPPVQDDRVLRPRPGPPAHDDKS